MRCDGNRKRLGGDRGQSTFNRRNGNENGKVRKRSLASRRGYSIVLFAFVSEAFFLFLHFVMTSIKGTVCFSIFFCVQNSSFFILKNSECLSMTDSGTNLSPAKNTVDDLLLQFRGMQISSKFAVLLNGKEDALLNYIANIERKSDYAS